MWLALLAFPKEQLDNNKENGRNNEKCAQDDGCLSEQTPGMAAVEEVAEGHRLNELSEIAENGVLVDGDCLGAVVHRKEQLIDEGTAKVDTPWTDAWIAVCAKGWAVADRTVKIMTIIIKL